MMITETGRGGKKSSAGSGCIEYMNCRKKKTWKAFN